MVEAADITLEAIEAARQRIAGTVLRTPLLRLDVDDAPCEIWLKLENLQPIGSFKLRGAGNAMMLADPERLFIHPVSDPDVIAGNGTAGLEIVEDLPEVDAVLVPYGGGGLSCGIATALHALRPEARVFGCEVATAAPLAAAFVAGEPREIGYTTSFVDGIGAKSVLDEMWPIVSTLLAGALVSSLEEVASALRLLVTRARIVAEGAGAVSVAAALAGKAGSGKVVCAVSGGNIEPATLARILGGDVPRMGG